MQKIFNTQKITAGLYTVAAVTVFIYTLCFMTEYKDLFGLKLSQNSQISFFHDSVLQLFNRQIFTFALIGVIAIGISFLLEIFSKVPDKFALFVIELLLIAGCVSSIYAISNILSIESFYRGLDFSNLYLEGVSDYIPRFMTFNIGVGIYLFNIVCCVFYGITIAMSHFKFLALRKTDQADQEKGSVKNG